MVLSNISVINSIVLQHCSFTVCSWINWITAIIRVCSRYLSYDGLRLMANTLIANVMGKYSGLLHCTKLFISS